MFAHHALRAVAAGERIARDFLALTGFRVLNDDCYALFCYAPLAIDDVDATPAEPGFDHVERLKMLQKLRFDIHLVAAKKRLGNLIGR